MTDESILRNPGENKNKQWYQLYPDRLAEEIELMRSAYPSFTLHSQEGENIYWTGKAVALKKDSSELASLNIKIECPQEYPIVFPRVYDLENSLLKRKCPHVTKNPDGSVLLCYGNRLNPELNFLDTARAKNVADYVCIFLARQWYFERYGKWPDGQPHGILPFLEREVRNGPVSPDALCLCGMTSHSYKTCHMPMIAKFLNDQDVKLKDEFKRMVPKIGRNDGCPCGSKMKSKKCCFGNLNHPSSKFFLLLKYPKAFGLDDELHKVFLAIFGS